MFSLRVCEGKCHFLRERANWSHSVNIPRPSLLPPPQSTLKHILGAPLIWRTSRSLLGSCVLPFPHLTELFFLSVDNRPGPMGRFPTLLTLRLPVRVQNEAQESRDPEIHQPVTPIANVGPPSGGGRWTTEADALRFIGQNHAIAALVL